MMTMPLTASVVHPRDTAGSHSDDGATDKPGLSFDAVLSRHVDEPGGRADRRASAPADDSRSGRASVADDRRSERTAAEHVTTRRATSDRRDTGRAGGADQAPVDPPTDDAAAAEKRTVDDADRDAATGDIDRDDRGDDRGTGTGAPDADAQPAGALATSTDRPTASAAAPLGQAPASPPEAPAPTVPADHESVAVVKNITTATDLATVDAAVVPTSVAPTAPVADAVTAGAFTHLPSGEAPQEPTITGVTVEVLTSSQAAGVPAGDRTTAPTAAPGAPAPEMPPMTASAPPHAASATTPHVATTSSPSTGDAPEQPANPTRVTTAAAPAGAPAPATAAAPPAPTDAAAAAATAATAGATAPAGPRATPRHEAAEPTAQPAAPLSSDRAAPSASSLHTAPASGPTATTADGQHVASTRLPDAVDQAQRELQIRRAEQITRLGVDVATEGLGAIRVEATNAGGGLQLQLGADRAATRQLLTDHAAALRDELGTGTTVSVDIGHARTGGDGRTPTSHTQSAPTVTSPHERPRTDLATATAVAPSMPRTGHDGRGVDVRL